MFFNNNEKKSQQIQHIEKRSSNDGLGELGDHHSEDQIRPVISPSSDDDSLTDAVFGDQGKDGPNYRNVGWIGTVALMLKTMIGLGVLSIPATFDILGMIPGIICLLTIATITTWSGYMVGKFKLNHRDCYGLDDAGRIMFGPVGREVLAVAYVLYQTICAGSGMISISIAFNSLSNHATCTATFVAVAAVIAFCFSSVRTLGKMTPLAWIGLVSIITGLLTLTVAVGVQDRPDAAPLTDTPFKSDFKLFAKPTFAKGISAVSTLAFSFAGTPSFFPIIAEMRDPRLYTRSLLLTQGTVVMMYMTVGIVVYYFCGSFVSSPALGSAGILMKKICYGLSLPGIIMSTTVCTHFPAKYIFVRILRRSRHFTSNTPTHWITWISCVGGCATFSYVISSAIPVFSDLLSLNGALLGTLMSMQPMACMWFYDNWTKGKSNSTKKFKLLVAWNIFIIVVGTFLTVAGTYGSVVGIMDSFKNGRTTGVWSCADNSNSS